MTVDTFTSLRTRLWNFGERALRVVEALRPLAQLAARVYVASVFFRSGLTNLRDWDMTLALFGDEYHVPLLSPTVAGLSVLNVVAVLSLADISEAALMGHVFWGSLLAAFLLWGPGRFSIDHVLMPKLRAWIVRP